MEKEFRKLSGFSLVVGSVMMVLTMVLHPSGGSTEHLLRIKTVLIGTHALAILSLPFIGFGFMGLSSLLATRNRLSLLALIISCAGLVAAMMAAAVNGLTLPFFLSRLSEQESGNDTVNLIRTYGHSLNIAMDYILIISLGLAIGFWSVLIIQGRKLPRWIGYYGLLLVLALTFALFRHYNMVGLDGFRMVVFGIVSWIVLAGINLITAKSDQG